MDQDMIEFYLTYKQNQNCKLQHNKKNKIPQNTPQSVNETKAENHSRLEGKQIYSANYFRSNLLGQEREDNVMEEIRFKDGFGRIHPK